MWASNIRQAAQAAQKAWKKSSFQALFCELEHFTQFALHWLSWGNDLEILNGILIESQMVPECSISAVNDIRHYNHGVRAHKYLYEALMKLVWAEFTWRLESSDTNHHITVASFLEQVNALVNNLKEESLDQLLQSPVLPQIWREFLNHLCQN